MVPLTVLVGSLVNASTAVLSVHAITSCLIARSDGPLVLVAVLVAVAIVSSWWLFAYNVILFECQEWRIAITDIARKAHCGLGHTL